MDGDTGYGRESADEVKRLVELLEGLPPGHVLTWGDGHQRLTDTVWRSSWIDVEIPELDEELQQRWSFTIVTPDDGDAPEPGALSCVIAVEPDCAVHTYIDPQTGWYAEGGEKWVTKPGELPPASFLESIRGRGEYVEARGWSLEAVTRALQEWCAMYAGRADISFSFDDSITMAQVSHAVDMLGKFQEVGERESYLLGDGIYGTGQFVDALLEMPHEEAAEVMRQIKHVVRGPHDDTGMGIT